MTDTHVENMFKHLDAVYELYSRRHNKKGIVNPIRKQYNQFKRAYALLTDEERSELFEIFFKSNAKLLTNRKSRSWMSETVYLYIDKSDDTMRINLSAFVRYASNIVSDTEEELRGLPESAAESRVELIYTDLIELYLYRIIAKVTDDKTVREILSDIETDLGEEVTNGPPPRPSTSVANNPLMNMGGFGTMMEQFTKVAGQLLSNPNITGTPTGSSNGEPVDPAAIMNSFMDIFKDGDKMSKMGEIVSDFQKTPPDQWMNKLKALPNDPTMQAIYKTIIDPNITPEMASQLVNKLNVGAAGEYGEGDIEVGGVYTEGENGLVVVSSKDT